MRTHLLLAVGLSGQLGFVLATPTQSLESVKHMYNVQEGNTLDLALHEASSKQNAQGHPLDPFDPYNAPPDLPISSMNSPFAPGAQRQSPYPEGMQMGLQMPPSVSGLSPNPITGLGQDLEDYPPSDDDTEPSNTPQSQSSPPARYSAPPSQNSSPPSQYSAPPESAPQPQYAPPAQNSPQPQYSSPRNTQQPQYAPPTRQNAARPPYPSQQQSQNGAPSQYQQQSGSQSQYQQQSGSQSQYQQQNSGQPQYQQQNSGQSQYAPRPSYPSPQNGQQQYAQQQQNNQPSYAPQQNSQSQYGSQNAPQGQYGSQPPSYAAQKPYNPASLNIPPPPDPSQYAQQSSDGSQSSNGPPNGPPISYPQYSSEQQQNSYAQAPPGSPQAAYPQYAPGSPSADYPQFGSTLPPTPIGSLPPGPTPVLEQFRLLVKDTENVLFTIAAYDGTQPLATKIVNAENKLGTDGEGLIFIVKSVPPSLSALIKAQPTIITFLRNAVKATNKLVEKKGLLKQNGADWYFLQILTAQRLQVQRMQEAINQKASYLERTSAKLEFNVVYKALDKAIAGWST